MTCEYDFTLEYYFTLTKACYNCPFNETDCQRPHCIAADGTPRGLIVANRMLPGPAIHVCKNDIVKVNILNRLDSAEGVTIHWHGLHQKGYQHMDGVPMVTQCPIPVETSFQYSFPAANLGTYFWHSHTGVQRADGLFGAFVVREPNDFHLYDYDLPEHTVVVFDWMIELAINRFANHHHAGGDNKPASMLINGIFC
ncbi:hypothetical protein KUTeg_024962 [Tegillarca granosa]|uniref:Plastocyanin-like domain-containing protein n=1 Tax=Tegillarca granosa TaxID=220873 RepID=A0ABQ9DYW6_TEGGR|nr:hypothetical protein KUTeg_024962 [Tegillarca granosa]